MFRLGKKGLSLILIVLLAFSQLLSFADQVTTEPQAPTELDSGINYLKLMIEYSKVNYYKDLTDKQIMEALYRGLFGAMDQHTRYYTPVEYRTFSEKLDGEYEGVGVSIMADGDYIRVAKPLVGGPAINAGMKIGDRIVSVDGVDIKGMGMEHAVTLIKGTAGTKVTLGVIREGVTGIIYFELTREKIHVSPLTYKILDGNIGYIQLEQFSTDSSHYVNAAIATFMQSGVKKIVFDIRDNPGGSLDQVVAIADYFSPKGNTLVKVDYKAIEDKAYMAELDPYDFKIAVLINGNSASASEIFAAAVKENKLGTVIGTTTYGKGTVQNLMPITNGGAIKMTVAEYFTPLGNPVDQIGVTPDIVIEPVVVTFEDVIRNYAPMNSLSSFKRGAKALDVKGMQQRLQYLGFPIAKIDGIFGPATEAQLKAFEKQYGLAVDGILDEVTKKKIDEVLKANIKPGEDVQLKKALEVLK